MPNEGRFSRWSRLKRSGGAGEHEERAAKSEGQAKLKEAEAPEVKLPGGRLRRRFVPAMPPLAAAPEEGDDHLTRGVGHEHLMPLDGDEAVPVGDAAQETDGIEERELTAEEKKLVDTLPPIENLNQNSDFSPFMQSGVPDFIRKRAMRKLWVADPFFNIRDGLDDYDDDFNILHPDIEPTFGDYKVGRGHLSEEELQEMMPEEARRAFDEPKEEEARRAFDEPKEEVGAGAAALTQAESDGEEAESSADAPDSSSDRDPGGESKS